MSPLVVVVSSAVTVVVLAALPPIYRAVRRVRTRAYLREKSRKGLRFTHDDLRRIMEDL